MGKFPLRFVVCLWNIVGNILDHLLIHDTMHFARSRKHCLLLLNACAVTFVVCFAYFRQDSIMAWKTIMAYGSNSTVNSTDNSTEDHACIRNFLKEYLDYCNTHLPEMDNYGQRSDSLLCPCIPEDLVGFVPVNETTPSLERLELEIPGLEEEGRWRPSWCVPRHRLAIIIPYADRETHLRIFLQHMHPFLQRQLVDYSFFVVEQLYPELFNRAMLMNVGFVEANATAAFDCFIFHDIDQLPIDDRNFYVCSDHPRHVVGYRKKFNYNYAYATSFGGGNSFTRQEFELINGYSNLFYGWGGEDDDLYQRTEAKRMRRSRYPRCIAKYDEVQHARDKRNPIGVNQKTGFQFRPDVYSKDGLNNLHYSVISTQRNKLLTKISVNLPPPPLSATTKTTSGWVVFLRSLFIAAFSNPDAANT